MAFEDEAARTYGGNAVSFADDGFAPDREPGAEYDTDPFGSVDPVVDDEYLEADCQEDEDPLESMTAKEVGEQGEILARSYLEDRGYEILECNLRNGGGECDIVAKMDEEVVLVEVKTRVSPGDRYGRIPELAVNLAKQERYRQIALWYLLDHQDVQRMRFDIIAINLTSRHSAHLRHLVGAFGCDM